MNLLVLGPQGAGKGTQAQRIAVDYAIPHISTGDMFRAAVEAGSPLGLRVAPILASGGLVPDEVTIELIRERLGDEDARRGFVLDGFPRNQAQAQALAAMLQGIGQPLDAVVLFNVDYTEIARRISGRRSCPSCGTIYNVHDAATAGITHCRNCAALRVVPVAQVAACLLYTSPSPRD